MPDYRNEAGEPTTADDGQRLLFYSVCMFWTDDWSKLHSEFGIPCCPYCKAVGFQTTAEEWDRSVQEFDKSKHSGYTEFVELSKESCFRNLDFMDEFLKWKEKHGKETN